jgi:hypothetical protein
MTIPYNPTPIDFSALAGIGQNIGGAIGQHNLGTAMRDSGAIGPDGTINYNKMVAVLAERRPDMAAKLVASQQDASGIYGTPIFMKGPNGEIKIGALGKGGGLSVQDAPEGYQPLEPQKFVDQGTHVTPYGTRSAQQGGPSIPIDIHGRESAEQSGAVEGKTKAAMPDYIQNVNSAIEAIDEAISHPGRETATGKSAWADPRNYYGGSDATGYREGILKKVSGQSFLASVQQMRGLGHLSDAEGKAATEANAALSTKLPDHEHLKQLRILKAIMLRGLVRAHEKGGMQVPPQMMGLWKQTEDEAGMQERIPFQGNIGPAANTTNARRVPTVSIDPATGAETPTAAGAGSVGRGGRPVPSPQQIELLKQHANNPEAIEVFEGFYGAGSADHFLSGGR